MSEDLLDNYPLTGPLLHICLMDYLGVLRTDKTVSICHGLPKHVERYHRFCGSV